MTDTELTPTDTELPKEPDLTKRVVDYGTTRYLQTERVTQALALVAKGKSAYAAANEVGIALSTIYRALRRQRKAESTHRRSVAAKKAARKRTP